tara:strand:- start:1136 stop:1567 length:432 start_codon:yes stop_codon:yes gene_type:complete
MKVKKINSLIDPEKTMHIMCRQDNEDFTRIDVVDEEQYLQLAVLKMYKGKTFKPHKHIFKNVPETSIAQESWFVSRGKVKAIFYDLDDSVLSEEILNQGDCSITLFGGHKYEILEDDTIVFEYKTGPYYGQKLDKEFLEEDNE